MKTTTSHIISFIGFIFLIPVITILTGCNSFMTAMYGVKLSKDIQDRMLWI